MSGDGRDESLGGTDGVGGGSGSAGLPSPQVPSQGGPAGSSGAPRPGRAHGPTGPLGPGPGTGMGAGAGRSGEHAVPQQREGGGLDSVLPPPRELPTSDLELIQRMREGDDSAYEELFRRHSNSVRRYAQTCCRDAHTADDLTAEVFARTLQAVRGGAGPEQAVRAYLLTTVRRVAAAWTKTAKREQLVEDFAVFAGEAARSSDVSDDTFDLGADVRAMHEAEQSLALQAFRSLPERWQAVLWHTTVEEESPSEVAPLFGLTANATAVLAGRAREGLKQAYLQAHVSSALTSGGDCARYADRLGAYARGGLRMRAERGLRKHLEECAKCRLAAGELAHVNAGIPALLPVAVIGWFAAGYSLKAAGIVAGGAAGAGVAAAATGGASGASGGVAGGAATEGLGTSAKAGIASAKAGIASAVAVAAAAGLVWAFAGDPEPASRPEARPPAADPVVPLKPAPTPKPPAAPEADPTPPQPKKSSPKGTPTPTPARAHAPTSAPAPIPVPAPTAKPVPPKPTPPAQPAPEPKPTPTPPPPPPPPPAPAPAPAPAPKVYQVNRLEYGVFGDHTAPEVRLGESGWLWRRWGMSIGGTRYGHGVTMRGKSSVTIDLNRQCSAYDALVGVDDLTLGRGAVRFSVYGDGGRLWRSPVMRGGDAAVPVHVPIAGRKTIRLVVEPHTAFDSPALGDWAQSRISCG
ncbi:sigma-70 family RNA polymerase sigma factor [Streptomyces sp. NBC_01142]|uniref:sigma-70 family RNA polymerase sigma factor n=1 Tax=Streptomyces sp. NBC_01142 TaxID=2975865 RepID=UPI00225BB4B5|nr:sigma-70 family RNA polymerase sigma factor [Streptomyces sp. NBC_01142]MCX4824116.1 sigma-70 family RNA polymerase sigma factor [Streptomyces sp. NBC_01142]